MTTATMSPPRRRMVEDMQIRGLDLWRLMIPYAAQHLS